MLPYIAIKHPMPHRVKSSFVIFDIRVLWRLYSTTVKNRRIFVGVFCLKILRWSGYYIVRYFWRPL